MGTAGIFVGHGFYKWFSLETIGRIREKNRHHGRGTEVPGPWNKQVKQRPAVIPRGDEAAEGNEPKRSPRKISRRERLVPEPGLIPESEAPRRNGVRQAERPTRTEKAMQLRVRRDMGWPPAEKRATAATSSSRRLITTGTLSPWFAAVKKSFAPASNFRRAARFPRGGVGSTSRTFSAEASARCGWGVSRMQSEEGCRGDRSAAGGCVLSALRRALDPVRARFGEATSWSALTVGCRSGIPRPSGGA